MRGDAPRRVLSVHPGLTRAAAHNTGQGMRMRLANVWIGWVEVHYRPDVSRSTVGVVCATHAQHRLCSLSTLGSTLQGFSRTPNPQPPTRARHRGCSKSTLDNLQRGQADRQPAAPDTRSAQALLYVDSFSPVAPSACALHVTLT